MAAITFDTHEFIRNLETAGFTEQQAEAVANAFKIAQGQMGVATRKDIEALRCDMKEMELRLTIKLGSMMALAIGVTAALVKRL